MHDGDNSKNSNKDGGIDGMLHHLGNGKKIGATFKFTSTRNPAVVHLSAKRPAKKRR